VDVIEEDLSAGVDHFGFSIYGRYGFDNWDFGVRFDYLEDVAVTEGDETETLLEERFRFSAAATYYWELSDELGGHIRLQGNFDDFEDRNEQSVFLQLGFDYGGSDGI